jgi:hypothetical protein
MKALLLLTFFLQGCTNMPPLTFSFGYNGATASVTIHNQGKQPVEIQK